MISWKILQFDVGGDVALAFAKSRVRRLISGGLRSFSRQWVVGDATARVRCMPMSNGFIARIWVTKKSGEGIYRLGEFVPTLTVTATNRVTGSVVLNTTREQILNTIVAQNKTTHAQAYPWVTHDAGFPFGTSRIIGFDSNLLGKGFSIDTIDDDALGITLYTKDITNSDIRLFEFATNKIWFDVAPHDGYRWVSVDVDKIINYNKQTFDVSVDKNNQPVDGTQTFNVRMAGGRFELPVPITFKDGRIINGYDLSTYTGTINPKKNGLWELVWISTTLVSDDNDKKQVDVVYREKYDGVFVYYPTDVNAYQVPDDETSAIVPFSSFFDGSIVRSTPAYTPRQLSYTVKKLLRAPAISSAPFPVIFYIMQDVVSSPDGNFQPLFGDNSGNLSEGIESVSSESFTLVYSDGSTAPALDHRVPDDPQPTGPFTYDVFGPNVDESVIKQDFVGDDLSGYPLNIGLSALGYDVVRGPTQTVPGQFETYTIQDLNGVELRLGIKVDDFTPLKLGGNAAADTGSQSIVIQTTSDDFYFDLYDAPVDVVDDLLLVMKMNVVDKKIDSFSMIVLPNGWNNFFSTFKTSLFQNVLDIPATYDTLITQINDYVDPSNYSTTLLYPDAISDPFPEMEDAVARSIHMNDFFSFMKTVPPITDATNIVTALNTVLTFYYSYSDAQADQTFPQYVSDLIDGYAKNNRDTPLSAIEISNLSAGYLSIHMRVVANALNLPYTTMLAIGPGTFFRIP